MSDLVKDINVAEFMELFRGRDDVYCVYTPSTESNRTDRKPLTERHFIRHLSGGKNSLGVIPVIPNKDGDSYSYFGCLDIDNHKNPSDISFKEIEVRIHKNKLPLVLCQSKSGSAHCYLFFEEPTPSKEVREMLRVYSNTLKGVGESDIEIFPKQDNIEYSERKKVCGSAINIPYYNAEVTNRYCIDNAQPRSLEVFIALAKSKRQSKKGALAIIQSSYLGIPPCLNTLLNIGIGEGGRNTAVYNFAIYAKKRFGEDWEEEVHIFNHKVCSNPLPEREVSSIVYSVSKKTYLYKCKEEPCFSVCDSKLCAKQKYGISDQEENMLALNVLPSLDNLKKFKMEPVRWEIDINGIARSLSTDELYEFSKFKKILLEQCNILVAPIKNIDWLAILKPLVEECENIDVPLECTPSGNLKEKMFMFFKRVDFTFNYMTQTLKDKEILKKPLMHGQPIALATKTGKVTIYFRGHDFMKYMRDAKMNSLPDKDVFYFLRREGVTYTTLKVNREILGEKVTTTGSNVLNVRVWAYTLKGKDCGYLGIKDKETLALDTTRQPITVRKEVSEPIVIDAECIGEYSEPLDDNEDF